MAILEGFKFVSASENPDEIRMMRRREKLVSHLQDQISLFNDPKFTVTEQRWKGPRGEGRTLVDHIRRPKPWWRKSPDGRVLLTVKAGNRALEFQAGRNAIELDSAAVVVEALQRLVTATNSGELDSYLATPSARSLHTDKPKKRS